MSPPPLDTRRTRHCSHHWIPLSPLQYWRHTAYRQLRAGIRKQSVHAMNYPPILFIFVLLYRLLFFFISFILLLANFNCLLFFLLHFVWMPPMARRVPTITTSEMCKYSWVVFKMIKEEQRKFKNENNIIPKRTTAIKRRTKYLFMKNCKEICKCSLRFQNSTVEMLRKITKCILYVFIIFNRQR